MPLDRRTFAKHLAAGAIAAAPAAALTAGESNADDKQETQAATEAKPRAPAEAQLELVKRLYPKNLDAAKLAQIRGQIEHHLSRSRVLSAFPLTNADEPAPVFAAWRG